MVAQPSRPPPLTWEGKCFHPPEILPKPNVCSRLLSFQAPPRPTAHGRTFALLNFQPPNLLLSSTGSGQTPFVLRPPSSDLPPSLRCHFPRSITKCCTSSASSLTVFVFSSSLPFPPFPVLLRPLALCSHQPEQALSGHWSTKPQSLFLTLLSPQPPGPSPGLPGGWWTTLLFRVSPTALATPAWFCPLTALVPASDPNL